MNTKFSYDKMDYYSILEYLKNQAVYFSNGRWSDFSDADIGTVILKLMAMNADTTNYQIEKGVSELYLDTVKERVNAIALCKLIGYEPRHYQSAEVTIVADYDGSSKSNVTIPAFTSFANSSGSVRFYTLVDNPIYVGINKIKAYQGELVSKTYEFTDIDDNGRIYLPDYEIGTNTIILKQADVSFSKVDNALYGEGELCFSVHIDLSNRLYIQLPTYYATIMSNSVPIVITYLLSNGVNGRIGAEVIYGTITLEDGKNISYSNPEASEGGYNPETVEEIRKSAPSYASTMNTLVTLNDFRILSNDFPGLADVVALDYNYPESGLVQPTDQGEVNDAYKVNLYMLPESADSIYKEEETDDLSQMTLLTPANFDIVDPGTAYTFNYNSTDGYFYNTNAQINNSSASIVLKTKKDWKKIVVKYETETEEFYDYLYIDVDNVTILKTSGEHAGRFALKEFSADTNIELSYIKDGTSYYKSDLVKIYFYATDEDIAPVYTEEYLDEIKSYISDVKKKKPAGIKVYYKDVEYIKPQLSIKVYMDENDLRYATTGKSIIDFLVNIYSRKNHKIGDPIYQSHISKEILSAYDYINYVEILELEGAVNGAIKPNRTQYVELLEENITVKVVPYES